MQVQQTLANSITINRFDTGDEITLDQNTPVDLDDATANYLISMRSYDADGNLLTNVQAI